MSPEEKPPSQDELLAMAYADNELLPEARRVFEDRLAREPALGRHVVMQRRLAILARESSPSEPIDHEWARIRRTASQRIGLWLAWALIVVGGVGLVGIGEVELMRSSADPSFKVLVTMLVAGAALLFAITLRGRLRTRHLDPYTEVKR